MPLPAMLLPFLGKYWMHLAGAIALSFILYQVHDHIGDQREDKVRAEYIKKAAEAEAAHKKRRQELLNTIDELNRVAEEESIKTSAKMTALQAEADRLTSIIKGIKLTTPRSVPSETGTAVEPRLAPAFRVCWAATVDKTPESIAACEAAGLLREVRGPG